MNPSVLRAIEKAEECLSDAEYSVKDDRYAVTINRCYYCIFDCIRALPMSQNIYTKTHQGTHTKFNEVFIKTNWWDIKFGAMLGKVFEMRQSSDYDLDEDFSIEEIQQALDSARAFLSATKDYFNRQT